MEEKKESSTPPRPQIILTDVTPSLEFSTEGSMKLEIDVKCLNLDLSKCDVIVDCKAFGVGNYVHESITEPNFLEGILSIHLLNSCSGCTVTTKVTAHNKITGPIKFYLPDEKLAEAEIVLKPTSQKKVGKVNWSIPGNNASNLAQGSPIANFDVELFGYNGQELLLIKNILEKGKVVFERLTSISVRENNISSKFFKSDCFTQTPDTEMTLAFQLFYKGEQLVFDDNTMTQRKDITLQKYQGVEKITSFPIQPVVVGQRDIIDKTFSPAEQQADRIQAMESAVDSNSAAESIVNSSIDNRANGNGSPGTGGSNNESDIKVEILDNDNNPVTADFIQIVNILQTLFDNIPEEKRTINDKSFDKYQLGNMIYYRVTSENIKEGDSYDLYLVPDSKNVQYSTDEITRNAKFKYTGVERLIYANPENPETKLKKILVQSGLTRSTINPSYSSSLSLTQAGGNKYKLVLIKSSYKGNIRKGVAESVTLTTWRKLFYQEFKLKDAEDTQQQLNKCIDMYNKEYFIDLQPLPFLDNYEIIHLEKSFEDLLSVHGTLKQHSESISKLNNQELYNYISTNNIFKIENTLFPSEYNNKIDEISDTLVLETLVSENDTFINRVFEIDACALTYWLDLYPYYNHILEKAIYIKHTDNNINLSRMQKKAPLAVNGIIPLFITYTKEIIAKEMIPLKFTTSRFTTKSVSNLWLYDVSRTAWFNYLNFFYNTTNLLQGVHSWTFSNEGKTLKNKAFEVGNTTINADQITLTLEKSNDTNFIKCELSDSISASITSLQIFCNGKKTLKVRGQAISANLNNIIINLANRTDLEYVIMHEIAHAIGMVPLGPKKDKETGRELEGYSSLDKPDFLYTDEQGLNHKGPHCSKGEYQDSKGCVMFGSLSKTMFCTECTPQVKKLDVSMFFICSAPNNN